MSAPQPPTLPSSQTSPTSPSYTTAKSTVAHTLLLATPILLLLPPRKLDLYTFSLSTAFVLSANEVHRERRGQSILERFRQGRGRKKEGVRPRSPPPSALAQAATTAAAADNNSTILQSLSDSCHEEHARVAAHKEKLARGQEAGVVGMAKKLWMGGEAPDWKERRLREEREALAQGKGYGGLIWEQIWEVWNGGKKREDGDGGAEGDGGKEDGEGN